MINAVSGTRVRPSRIWLIGVLAYLPVLLTKPGRLPADTKLYLYLNPGRLIADAPFSWDGRQFGGWVPHQTIAYLWPQGPWYWMLQHLGSPDWVAHRLWIGTLLFVAAGGVMWTARLLGLNQSGALVAAIVYQLSPYILPYVSRTSALLLPWAALGWMIGLTICAATGRNKWRHAAMIALVLATCSAVNPTAIIMIAPGPVLWLVHAAWQRSISWRAALMTSVSITVLAVPISLWWIVMFRQQTAYGADVLAFSESLEAVSATSTSTEAIRGLGYWLFYIRDAYGFTTTASQRYMESGLMIGIGFALVLVCFVGLAITRWPHRRFAALLLLVGTVLAVGVHPIDDASPLMSSLAANSRSSLALAMRSSTRALPLSILALSLGVGALVTAVAATRWRFRAALPMLVIALAIVNLPALFTGGLVDPALERDQDPPDAWLEAAADLSRSSSEYRVLQLPGSEFGAFRWGYTVDPPLPGLTTKPILTRDLLPLGSAGAMDLLYALDDRAQTGILDPRSIPAVARYLAVDTVWLANDLAFERFRTPRPSPFSSLFSTATDGLGSPRSYGVPQLNTPLVPMIDEHSLSQASGPLAAVQLVGIDKPQPIVRASARVVVLAGSGDGVVDAAAAGLLTGDEALLYAAEATSDDLDAAALFVLTDSNRDRAHHWRGSQDVVGFTESGGSTSDLLVPDSADQRLAVFGQPASADSQTVATLSGGIQVRASGYGEPFAYRPEDRPAMAADGDPTTAWVVADRADPIGQFIALSETNGSLHLLQPQSTIPNRMISEVSIDVAGSVLSVALDERSLVAPGQPIAVPSGPATVRITQIAARPGGTDTGPSAVGFSELGVGAHTEIVRLPQIPSTSTSTRQPTPVAVVVTRLRIDPLNRWRSDPEQSLQRQFDLADPQPVTLSVTLMRNDRASDQVLNSLQLEAGPVSNRRLTGDPNARGRFVADGDQSTAWTSPFGAAVGSQFGIALKGQPMSSFEIRQPVDAQHSLISKLRVDADTNQFDLDVPLPDAMGISVVTLPQPISAAMMTLTISGISPKSTVDRRYGETTELPVGIYEIASNAIQPSTSKAFVDTCRDDLLSIDGKPVPLSIDASQQASISLGIPVTVSDCTSTPRTLAAGTHSISSTAGLVTGLDVNQVVLQPTNAVATAPATAPTVTMSRTRTTRTAQVAACPTGCWIVLGEGYNRGWSATRNGQSLGPPRQIDGGFNGWWLEPNSTASTVEMRWTGQRPVTLALVISLLTALACVALMLGLGRARRAKSAVVAFAPPRLVVDLTAPTTMRRSAMTAALLVGVTTIAVSPVAALFVAPIALAIVVTRRPALAPLTAVVGLAAIGARILQRQVAGQFIAGAQWPAIWDKLHQPGLIAVVLLTIPMMYDNDAAATGSADDSGVV